MPLIQSPGPGRKLQQGLRLVALPDAVLSPEIVAVVVVEDFSAPLSDISRACIGSEAFGSAVAQLPIISMVRVGNPAPYDQIITKVFFSSENDQAVHVVRPSAAVVGITISDNTGFTDFNLPGRPTSQLGFFEGSFPAGINILQARVLAGVFYQFDLNVRMGTVDGFGNALLIVGSVANTVLFGGFEWTESDLPG